MMDISLSLRKITPLNLKKRLVSTYTLQLRTLHEAFVENGNSQNLHLGLLKASLKSLVYKERG